MKKRDPLNEQWYLVRRANFVQVHLAGYTQQLLSTGVGGGPLLVLDVPIGLPFSRVKLERAKAIGMDVVGRHNMTLVGKKHTPSVLREIAILRKKLLYPKGAFSRGDIVRVASVFPDYLSHCHGAGELAIVETVAPDLDGYGLIFKKHGYSSWWPVNLLTLVEKAK